MNTRCANRLSCLVLLAVALGLSGCASPTAPRERRMTDGARSNDAASTVDPRYTPEALMRAFQKLCDTLGYRAIRAQIDDSEFPYLVYGVIAERCEYGDLRDTLSTMPGYAYSGSLVVQQRDGAYSLFSLNMIPRTEYSQDAASRRRLVERMRELAVAQR